MGTLLFTLIPTRSEEGTALAALESMSCGTATLSTNVGGLKDLPTRQCDPNTNELAQLITECYDRRNEIAESQKKEVEGSYNIEKFKQAWQQVISE